MTIQSIPKLKTNDDHNSYFYGVFEPELSDKGRKVFEFFCGFLRLCGGQFTCSFYEFNEFINDHNIQWKVKTLDEKTKKVADQWIAFNSTHTLNGYECYEIGYDQKLKRTLIMGSKYEISQSEAKLIQPSNFMDLIDLRSKELKDKIQSFNDFYIFYLQEHSKQGTRNWHMGGTAAAVTCFALGMFSSDWFFALAPLAGYGPAWYSHLKIEENKPATWLGIKEVFKSLSCDFVMSANRIRGTLNDDLRLSGVNPDKK